MTRRSSERGNVFFALFGAVALVGVVGAATSTLMRGPLSTVVSVNQRAKADTQMQIASKLAMVRATQEVDNGGDCDMDGTIEPIAPDAMAGLTGGGALPASIGSSQLDPWNTRYGYCVWDLGAVVGDASCGGPGVRLAGGLNESYPVMVIISAGPNKAFDTVCNAWVGGGAPPHIPTNADFLIDRTANTPNDDIVLAYTYSEAVEAAGGLWSLMSGDPDTITTDKNVAFSSGTVDFSSGTTASFQGTAQFAANSRLDLGLGGMFLLPDQTSLTTCNTANDAALRINKSSGLNVIEMCDLGAIATYPNGWVPLGGAGATVSMIDDLTDAISYPTKGILFMGDRAGMNYSSSTGANNNIGIGINAGAGLTTGGTNIVIGNHPLEPTTSASIAIGYGMSGAIGANNLRIANFLTGSNIYSSSGSLGVGGDVNVGATARASRFEVDNAFMDTTNSGLLTWGLSGTEQLWLDGAGNLGVGTSTPTDRLTVGGNAYISGRTSSNTYLVRDWGSPMDPGIRFGEDPLLPSGLMGEMVNGVIELGFVISGSDHAWLSGEGFGIGKKPTAALDVVGQGIFSDRVTSTGFQFSSGQGLFPSGTGLSLNAGGSPHLYLSSLGNVGIGVASPSTMLDVGGAIRVGNASASACDTPRAGSIRYTSGDQLQVCSSVTGNWETIGASGGGGGGSGSYWTRVSAADPRLYYAAGDVGVGVSDPLADFHVNGNVLATGIFDAGDTTPVAGSGTRMMFVPRKSAFRAGTVTGNTWDNASIGNYSTGFGYDTTASGSYSFVTGLHSAATADFAFSAGRYTRAQGALSVALGHEVTASGANSFAFGLGDSNAPVPVVSGSRSFGIFMGDQAGVNITTSNLMALLGGRLIIDPNPVSATNIVPSGSLTVDIHGNVGAMQYCDENGANCFTAGDISGGGVGVWEDASNVIRLTSGTVSYSSADFVFGSPQLADDGVADHFSRMFFDKSKASFRAGLATGTQWDESNIGFNSLVFGADSIASGEGSIVLGADSEATGVGSFVLGGWNSVSGENSATLGVDMTVTGNRSLGIGLHPAATGSATISGNDNFVLFGGDSSGVDVQTDNTFAVLGYKTLMSLTPPANPVVSGTLTLDVDGQIGAVEYCDEEGDNCFNAADLGSASGADGTIQFASAGKFASSPDFVFSSATGNVGVGTASPLEKLHVDGKIRVSQSLLLDPVAGAAPSFIKLTDLGDTDIGVAVGGDVLTYSSASGKWVNSPAGALSVVAAGANRQIQFNDNNAFGAAATFSYTPGGRLILNDPATRNNFFITGGVDTTDGQWNLAIGPGALTSLAASGCSGNQCQRNLAIGYNALHANTTGFDNLAIGYINGAAMTTGNNNTTIGAWGFAHNTVGSYNASLGMAALYKNTTGGNNAAFGAWAMSENQTGSGNVAMGFETLKNFNGGSDNIALGRGTMFGVTGSNGSRNIAVGALSGGSLTSGSYNILLGHEVNTPLPTTNNYLNIGNAIRGDMTTATIEFNGTGALVLPRGTDGGRPSAAVDGMLRYNSTSGRFEGFQGGSWQDILTGAATGGISSFVALDDTPSSYAGVANQYVRVNAATNALEFTDQIVGTYSGVPAPDFIGLDDLSDVNLAVTPVGGDFLKYDSASGSWQAGSLAGSVASAAGANRQIQFNNGGVMGASSSLVFSSSGLLVKGDAAQLSSFISDTVAQDSMLQFQQGTGSVSGAIGAVGTTRMIQISSAISDIQLSPVTGIVRMAGTGALVLPSGDNTARAAITSPVNGMLRYNSSSNKFEGYQGGVWQDILTGAASNVTFVGLNDTPSSYAAAANQFVRVNAATNALEFTDQVIASVSGQPLPGFIGLNDLSNVDLSVAPTNGQSLTYDGGSGTWKAAAGGGGSIDSLSDGISNGTSTVFLGAGSGVSNTGLNNTAVGIGSLAANTTGSQNTALGYQAGSTTTTGSGNILIGQGVLALAATTSSYLNIGNVISGDMATGDIAVNGTAALAVPRGTTAQQPTGVNGMIRYNTTNNKFEVFENGDWVNMVGPAAGACDATVTFSSPGTYSYKVPPAFGSLTITLWGAGGGGGGGSSGTGAGDPGVSGEGTTIISLSLNAGGGVGGNQSGRLGGAGGTASGGNVNIDGESGGNGATLSGAGGSAPNGGAGGAAVVAHISAGNPGETPGAGGSGGRQGASNRGGGGGGSGAYVQRTYTVGAPELSPGIIISDIVVGAGGDGGTLTQSGGNGAHGQITINCSSSMPAGADHEIVFYNNGDLDSDPAFVYDSGRMGINNGSPTVTLDINGTDAVIIPRGTTAQEPTAANGMLRYDTTTNKLRAVQGGVWADVIGGGSIDSLSDGKSNGTNTVFLGTNAGQNNTGANNTAVGINSLANGTGTHNVAVGTNTLPSLTNGSNNVALGALSGNTLTTGSYNILLGYNLQVPSPSSQYYMSIADSFYGYIGASPRFGIGKYPDAGAALDVVGNVQYTGVITDVSDMRLKTDIHPLRDRGSMLDKLGQFDVYSFRMKGDDQGQVEFGVMAQEMQKIFPELVMVDTSKPEHYMSVNYVGLISPLIAATQELKAENDNLKSQIYTLETRMASFEADMRGMKAHTGYGIGKAGFGVGMATGLILLGGMGAAFRAGRRKKSA